MRSARVGMGLLAVAIIGCSGDGGFAARCEGPREVAAFALKGLEGDAEGTAFMDNDTRSSIRANVQRQLSNPDCFTDEELSRMEAALK